MHRTPVTAALVICGSVAFAPWALAEMGPCQPDKFDGLTCRSGIGAARVIADTLSPSKRLALAWRSPKGPPTEIPSGDTEILVVRVADGAILATSTGTYFDTGESRANRLDESATWSPNSRLLVRTFDSRFSTDNIDLYSFGANDEATGPVDLLKLIEPAIRAHLKRRVKNEQKYVLSIANDPAMSVGNGGLVRARVTMSVPKEEPERNYNVTVRVMLGAKPLAARIVAVVPARAQP
jgi:hypothetical protein